MTVCTRHQRLIQARLQQDAEPPADPPVTVNQPYALIQMTRATHMKSGSGEASDDLQELVVH